MKRLIDLLLIISLVLSLSPAMAEDNTPTVVEEPAKLENLEVGSVNTGVSRSGEIPHPYNRNDIRWALIGYERGFVTDTLENNMMLSAELRTKSLEELKEYITVTVKSLANTNVRHDFEKQCAAMAIIAEDTDDQYMMKQVITVLYTAAKESASLPIYDDIYNSSQKEIPALLVFAYDIAFYNPYWNELSGAENVDTRAVFEQWVLDAFDRVYEANHDREITNYGGYWNKHMAGVAVILNDPDRVRKTIETLDQALRISQFYGDGMWREGTFSYGQMLVGNCSEALNVIALYKDPDDYADTKFGLKLDHTNLESRWPIIRKWLDEINEKTVYPNGAPVAINDNHYNSSFTYETPIKAENLKNSELNHFGLYSLKYGNPEEAQQINLKFPPMSEGIPYSAGHSHGDFLGLSMWSAGMEILPDGGYVFTPAANRYLHMSAYTHNCSWIYSPKVSSYSDNGHKYVLNNTLAYDDGSANGKHIQLIEAESRHTVFDGVDMKRRMLMMIAVDENHSYTVDIQRLKGGTVHENFLRQVEEEDVTLTTNLSLPATQSGTLGSALQSMGKSGGIVLTESSLTSPQLLVTDNDIDFIWKGVDTGVSMNAHLKGNKGTTVAFAKFPTMRRVNNDVADKDKYPGYLFYQRQDVNPDDVTILGGVYEGYRSGETANVKNVEWISAPDGDEVTQIVRIELPEAVDYIYISNDTKVREYNGISFSGNYVAIRMDKAEKEVLWQYIYGEGNIKAREKEIVGENDYLYQVLNADGRLDSTDVPNKLRVRGVLPENVKGLWGHTIYGDGSGVAFEITDVNQSNIYINNPPGFEIKFGGALKHNFPAYIDPVTGGILETSNLKNIDFHYQDEYCFVIPGNVWFEVKIPTFVEY